MKYLSLLLILVSIASCKDQSESDNSNLKIVYNVLMDEDKGDYEVFIMDLDGQNKRNLSNSPSVDWAYHSENDLIYFLSDRDTCASCFFLYTINSSGSELTKISELRLSDSWLSTRKNGSEIIVKPHRSIDSVFYIINDKGELIEKLDPGLAYINDPLFIGSEEKIVFRGSKKHNKQEAGYIDELYSYDLNDKRLAQISNYPKSDTSSRWYNYHAGPPRWNNKLKKVSYISFQNFNYSIFLTDIEGKEVEKISEDGFNQAWHSWSQDGELLVFDGSGLGADTNYDIYLLNSASTTPIRLTSDSLYEQAPMFVH